VLPVQPDSEAANLIVSFCVVKVSAGVRVIVPVTVLQLMLPVKVTGVLRDAVVAPATEPMASKPRGSVTAAAASATLWNILIVLMSSSPAFRGLHGSWTGCSSSAFPRAF
jgi:hypothetical protein